MRRSRVSRVARLTQRPNRHARMRTALVLLSDHDSGYPRLDSVATVSKDLNRPGYDHGAWTVGIDAASRGILWVDRPYYVGNPDPEWLRGHIRSTRAVLGTKNSAYAVTQIGNEPNHPDEHWNGGLAAYEAFFQAATAGIP